MILYHGSNMEVSQPRLIPAKRLLDFGAGFYLTTDFEQAKKWAIRTAQNRELGTPTVSVFDIDKIKFDSLEVLIFKSANKEWLRFVAANRTNKPANNNYDVIIGPVANDQVIRTVNNYLSGYFTEDIAIQLLLPQKLNDQYTFKTQKSLSVLTFKEAKIICKD